MSKLRSYLGDLAAKPWIAGLLIIKEVIALLYMAMLWLVPKVAQLYPKLPPMPDIDWLDLMGKLVIVFVVISLQRSLKRSQKNLSESNAALYAYTESMSTITKDVIDTLQASACIQLIRANMQYAEGRPKIDGFSMDYDVVEGLQKEVETLIPMLIEREIAKDREEAMKVAGLAYGVPIKPLMEAKREPGELIITKLPEKDARSTE